MTEKRAYLRGSLKVFWEHLLFLFFPPSCASCRAPLAYGQAGKMLCPECLSGVECVTSPRCNICGIPFSTSTGPDHLCVRCMEKPPSFDSARAVYVYKGTVRRLIHRVKFQGDGYALKCLCAMFRQAFIQHEMALDVPVIPIPLHRIRLRDRGFNQAVSLARRLFPAGQVQVELLERTRNTRPQMRLSVSERRVNIRGAFSVRGGGHESLFKSAGVILFDDIMTTGSTADSAARELKKAGAQRVDVITVARAVRHRKIQLDI